MRETAKAKLDKKTMKDKLKQLYEEAKEFDEFVRLYCESYEEKDNVNRYKTQVHHMRHVIKKVIINKDHRDGGVYAFVKFDRVDDAEGVLDSISKDPEMNRFGLLLQVEWAKPKGGNSGKWDN